MAKEKVKKKLFKTLTGVVVGGAIGSILGLTLAPKKGEESRKYLKDKSLELFLDGKAEIDENKAGPIKRILIKLLTTKRKRK